MSNARHHHTTAYRFCDRCIELGPKHWVDQVHSLYQCSECGRVVLEGLGLASIEALEGLADPFALLSSRLDILQGEEQLAKLEGLSPAARRSEITVDASLRNPSVIRALLARCRNLWSQEPDQALSQVNRAVELTLPGSFAVSEDWISSELKALVWAYRGNVFRVAGNLPEASACFHFATEQLKEGWSDEVLVAEYYDLRASFRIDNRDLEDALADLDVAARSYAAEAMWASEGKALINRSRIYDLTGDYELGLRVLSQAEALVLGEPTLAYHIICIRLSLLSRLGRQEEATALLPTAYQVAAEHGTPHDPLRIRWCEGLLAQSQGDWQSAACHLRAVQQGFLDAELAYEVALVALDLAEVLLEQGHLAQVRTLAAQTLALHEAQGVETGVLAALRLFTEACGQELLTAQALTELKRLVRTTA